MFTCTKRTSDRMVFQVSVSESLFSMSCNGRSADYLASQVSSQVKVKPRQRALGVTWLVSGGQQADLLGDTAPACRGSLGFVAETTRPLPSPHSWDAGSPTGLEARAPGRRWRNGGSRLSLKGSVRGLLVSGNKKLTSKEHLVLSQTCNNPTRSHSCWQGQRTPGAVPWSAVLPDPHGAQGPPAGMEEEEEEEEEGISEEPSVPRQQLGEGCR